MSNVATVTPYQPTSDGIDVGASIGALAAIFATTDEERDVIDRYKAMARNDRLSVARLDARLADGGDLLTAARSLGYVGGSADAARLAAGRPVELLGSGGSSMMLQRVDQGIAMVAPGGRTAIDHVVRNVSLNRTQRHLEAISGGSVARRQLPNGEIELRAREAPGHPGGGATVTTRIDSAGNVRVDISQVRGNRCATVMEAVAEAVGGTIDTQTLKPDYYVEPVAPGEPVHINSGS